MSPYRRHVVALALALFTGGLAVGRVHAAASFLITDQSSSVIGGIDDKGGQFGAGQFTLTNSATITVADASLDFASDGTGLTTSNLAATIVNDSSNTPGMTIFGTSTSTSGTLSGSFSPITFNFSSASLPAGTYWLEISNSGTSSQDYAWALTTPTMIINGGTDGAVNHFTTSDGNAPASTIAALFDLNGSVTPEPATLSLLSLCSMGLLLGGLGVAFGDRFPLQQRTRR